jgi:hypothetical protein
MPLLRSAACLLTVAGLVTAAHGDVFMRIGSRPDRALEQAGGRSVYQADVLVNGQPGSLSLLGFDQPAGALAAMLARKLGLPEPAAGGAADGTHLAGVSRGRFLNLILLPGGQPDTTLALLVDQRAAAAPRTPAQEIEWPAIPHPVTAAPIFTAVNLASRTTLAVARAPAAAEALHAEMQSLLLGDGWQPAAPRVKNGGLALYSRGHTILMVFTQSSADHEETRITLLQRLDHAP